MADERIPMTREGYEKLKGDLDTEGGQLNAANALAAADNSFIQANEAVLLDDRLAGQRIAFTGIGYTLTVMALSGRSRILQLASETAEPIAMPMAAA